MPTSPLPPRGGLAAARLRMPDAGPWRSLREHLHERVSKVTPERIDQMLRQGRYVDESGAPLGIDSPFVPRQVIWFHRDLPTEVPVPFDVDVLHQDERLVVVDKPHFLATIPRGQHIQQTVLVRLRAQLGLPELSPAHRLDRGTAGVLLLTTNPQWRGAYQNIFRDRLAHKTYLAVADRRDELRVATTVESHIVKQRGVLQAKEYDDRPPNARTSVQLIAAAGDVGLYRCIPHTGRTHQIRLHLARLGIPIVNDPFYPDVVDRALDDFSRPLQLLAESLSFPDPISGDRRTFRTRRALACAPTR